MEQNSSPHLTLLIAQGYSNKFLLEEGLLICPAYPDKCYKISEVPNKKVIPDPFFEVTIYAFITPDGLMGTLLLPWERSFEEY